MKKVLSIKKSLRLLTDIVAYGAMILWVLFLIVLMSTPSKAQDLNNPIVEYVDQNCYKVFLDHGSYYHIDQNSVPNGWFKYVSNIDGMKMVQTGQMRDGHYVGRVVYTVNGKKVMIRKYNIDGVLIKSTKINVSIGARS